MWDAYRHFLWYKYPVRADVPERCQATEIEVFLNPDVSQRNLPFPLLLTLRQQKLGGQLLGTVLPAPLLPFERQESAFEVAG